MLTMKIHYHLNNSTEAVKSNVIKKYMNFMYTQTYL